MIDLHCHMLPGIDDGAEDIDISLEMARMAVDDGITHCVFTPHLHEGRWDNRQTDVETYCADFRRELEIAGIPLNVSYSVEVRIGAEMLGWVANNEIPFLGEWEGEKVLLLELPHGQIPPGAKRLVAKQAATYPD